jgi:hypothetical protein
MSQHLKNSLIDATWRWGAIPWFFASLAVLVGATLLLRRFGGAPLIVLVIGAAAFVLERAIEIGLTALLMFIPGPYPGVAYANGPCLGLNPAFYTAQHISHLVGSICFPVGFFWYALRATRASNQAMQRTADRSDA